MKTHLFIAILKLCWNYDKNDSLNYLDKFYYHSFNSLGGLARLAFNGFLFLTKKGKVNKRHVSGCVNCLVLIKKKCRLDSFVSDRFKLDQK